MAHDPTKARLLEAAGEEFAEKGFEGATIRSIAGRAGANVAAVNYHFGDKERLYEAAVVEAHRCGRGEPEGEALGEIAPEAVVRGFVHRFLENVLSEREGSWYRALMLRELIQPTGASDLLVRESIGPQFERLIRAFGRLCPDADERRLHAMAFSVVGQCLHYKVSRSISTRLVGEAAYARLDLDYLTDHVTTVCLAAIGLAAPLGERQAASAAEGGA